MNLWTNPAVVPKQYLMLASHSPFQDITQNHLRMNEPLACERLMTSSSSTRGQCFDVEFSHLIWKTLQNLIWLCLYQLFRNLDVLLQSEIFRVFLLKCKLCELIFPMNTDASKCWGHDIPRIIDCSSMSCIASSEERSNIFRKSIIHSVQWMIVILEQGSILWQCQSPNQYRWQTCQMRFVFDISQDSRLEKTLVVNVHFQDRTCLLLM